MPNHPNPAADSEHLAQIAQSLMALTEQVGAILVLLKSDQAQREELQEQEEILLRDSHIQAARVQRDMYRTRGEKCPGSVLEVAELKLSIE